MARPADTGGLRRWALPIVSFLVGVGIGGFLHRPTWTPEPLTYSLLEKISHPLAWPITVLLLGLIFRREIRKLINAIEELKVGSGSARMQRRLNRAEMLTEEIPMLDMTEPQGQNGG